MSHFYPTAPSSSNFQLSFHNALDAYQRRTKINLLAHPISTQLEASSSTATIFAFFQQQILELDRFRSGDDRWTEPLGTIINFLHALSASLRGSLVSLET